MRIEWKSYVEQQLAWWSALSRLSINADARDREYLARKALAAFSNANGVLKSKPLGRKPAFHA